MATKAKILVVDSDLTTLSRVYLALVHRNYKTEASDKEEEITERVKRLKPALLILGTQEFLFFRDKLKLPCIVLANDEDAPLDGVSEDIVVLHKPVHLDALLKQIEEMVY
jgi:hypothetical protein